MGSVLVSVLTPSLNQGRWLADNLQSVTAQSYPSIEHIVMDGGSTDGSVEILRKAVGNVRWRSEPDRGQSHALNKAFAESSGEIVGWLNSDDAYFTRDAVGEAVAAFNRHPDVAVIYGHAALVNSEGLVLHMVWVPPFSYQLLRLQNFIIQPAAFVRRSALNGWLANEAFEGTMDRELWLRLGRHHSFRRVNRILAIDRHQMTRKSYSRPDLMRKDTERLGSMYRLPTGRSDRVLVKALAIIYRFLGLRLVIQVNDARPAFNALRRDGWRLSVRQVAMKRASMPEGRPGHA